MNYPINISQYFNNLFENYHNYIRIVVIDPSILLGLEKEYIDTNEKKWKVYHYYGNDLSFRKEYEKKPSESNFPHIILITNPQYQNNNIINVSYIHDIIEKAEEIIDIRIDSIIKELIPEDNFPKEILLTYEKYISENISKFIEKSNDLRLLLTDEAPFTKENILEIILAVNNDNTNIKEFFIRINDPKDLIIKYTELIFAFDFDPFNMEILKTIMIEKLRLVDEKSICYLDIEKEELSVFYYIYWILIKNNIKNPIIHSKGLGTFGFDEGDWIKDTEDIVKKLHSKKNVWKKLVCVAEDNIKNGMISALIDSLGVESREEIIKLITDNSSPILIYGLLITLIKKIFENNKWKEQNKFSFRNLEMHPLYQEDIPNSKYKDDAKELLNLFIEADFIFQILQKNYNKSDDIIPVLEWYKENKIYRLSLSLSKIFNSIKVINDFELRKRVTNAFEDYVKVKIQNFLHNLDLYLVKYIENKPEEYYNHPKLSINIIKDSIIKKGISPSENKKIWILIFDGMRLDSWNEVIKPVIIEKFEILEEELYFCVIPSTTNIARISLLAGKIPSEWKDYYGKYTSDHNKLASCLFNLNPNEGRKKLRTIVASETDYGQRRLDFEKKPYNVLIYNLSDDWIHSYRGDIRSLNDKIHDSLIKDIIPDLERRIGLNDIVLISSDHGFIELERNRETKIIDVNPSQVKYRYLENIEHRNGVRVKYNPKTYYTVAKGRDWFARERGGYDRYSHGGISFYEMIVPSVTLKKSSNVTINFELFELENEIEVLEDNNKAIYVSIRNTGNSTGTIELTFKLDSIEEKKERYTISTQNEQKVEFNFKASLRNKKI